MQLNLTKHTPFVLANNFQKFKQASRLQRWKRADKLEKMHTSVCLEIVWVPSARGRESATLREQKHTRAEHKTRIKRYGGHEHLECCPVQRRVHRGLLLGHLLLLNGLGHPRTIPPGCIVLQQQLHDLLHTHTGQGESQLRVPRPPFLAMAVLPTSF